MARNMSTPMTECDPHPWLLFFVESRLWQFELVPPFYEGSDRARCENGYALQVFKNLAARSPQLQTLSYRMINTMNGPPRLPPFFYEPGELLYPPNQIVPSEAVWTHHVLAEVNFAPATAAALLATCREMRTRILLFLREQALLHVIVAPDPGQFVGSSSLWLARHRMPDELRCILRERQHNFFLCRDVPVLALEILELRSFGCCPPTRGVTP